jgi:hypothetical protein
MYSLRDIFVGLSGEMEVDAKGDLRLGNAFESTKSAINFIARTDKGDYVPDPRVGGDPGAYLGEPLSKDVTVSLENSIRGNLQRFVLNSEDFVVHAIPITHEDVGLFIGIGGQYIDPDGNLLEVTPEVISFSVPHIDIEPTPDPES